MTTVIPPEPRQLLPTDHVLTLPDVALHYVAWGNATNPPLILLHGGAAHAHWWDHIAPVLAQDFYVLAPDLRGHGDSSWVTGDAVYQIEHYVADLAALVTALALPPFVLLGHSLGGFVAMSYASAHAQQLRALIVVDIGPRIGGSRFMRLLQHMPSPIYESEADVYARFRLLPEQTHATPDLFRHIARQSVKPTADGTWTLKCDRATLHREPRDLGAHLTNIHCPMLVLRGSESRNLSPTTFAEMLRLCPQVQGAEIPGAGHHIFLDNPGGFLTVVRDFVVQVRE